MYKDKEPEYSPDSQRQSVVSFDFGQHQISEVFEQNNNNNARHIQVPSSADSRETMAHSLGPIPVPPVFPHLPSVETVASNSNEPQNGDSFFGNGSEASGIRLRLDMKSKKTWVIVIVTLSTLFTLVGLQVYSKY